MCSVTLVYVLYIPEARVNYFCSIKYMHCMLKCASLYIWINPEILFSEARQWAHCLSVASWFYILRSSRKVCYIFIYAVTI